MAFEALTSAVESRLKELGYFPWDSGGGERHGALEWVWTQRSGSIRLYVTMAIIEPAKDEYEVEVWAGASDGTRRKRILVGRSLLRDSPDSHVAEVLQRVQDATAQAWEIVKNGLEEPLLRY